MNSRASTLPQLNSGLFLTYTGMETDLIFTQNVDLPGFASYPLLQTDEGRAHLNRYACDLIALGKEHDVGIVLESAAWVANHDRGAAIGYSSEQLGELNKQAIALLCEARDALGDLPAVISANVGPRADAYAPSEQMNAAQAKAYHYEQIGTLAETDLDMISAYTIAYPAEAIGIVQAATSFEIPVLIAFTVETDGRLPTGALLEDVIKQVDVETDGYPHKTLKNDCSRAAPSGVLPVCAPCSERLRYLEPATRDRRGERGERAHFSQCCAMIERPPCHCSLKIRISGITSCLPKGPAKISTQLSTKVCTSRRLGPGANPSDRVTPLELPMIGTHRMLLPA